MSVHWTIRSVRFAAVLFLGMIAEDCTFAQSSSGSKQASSKPPVPGFGVESDLPPVPGFGERATFYAVRVTDSDRREAAKAFRYYDRNKDGVLDHQEMQRSRSGDLLQYDRNRDGKLTLSEMALRYARRRIEKQQSEKESKSRSSGGQAIAPSAPSSRSSNSTSGSGSSKRRSLLAALMAGRARRNQQKRFAETTFNHDDENSDGVIEHDEWGSTHTDFQVADKNGDRRVSREEFAAWLASKDRRRGSNGNLALDSSNRTDKQVRIRRSYRILSSWERLPKGLPEWFTQRDSDRDGQVLMAEYSTTWFDEVVDDYAQFDLNGNGVITPKECLLTTEKGAVRRAEDIIASIEKSSLQVASQSSQPSTKVSKRKMMFLRALFLAKTHR